MAEKKKILLMDDEELITTIASKILDVLGFSTEITRSGEEMLNIYEEGAKQETPFEIVILDLGIPNGMGGEEAGKLLLRRDPEAKIIVTSGDSLDPIVRNYETYGFKASLIKPFTLENMQEAVKKAL